MGHHLDDQVETFFLRLLRGAGLHGLAAMPARRSLGEGVLQRPLLAFTRVQLEAYASDQGWAALRTRPMPTSSWTVTFCASRYCLCWLPAGRPTAALSSRAIQHLAVAASDTGTAPAALNRRTVTG